MEEQKPTVGRIVHYYPSDDDRILMNGLAAGNTHLNQYAAIITAVWSNDLVNLKVFLDGPIDLTNLSASLGDEHGMWSWPKRV